jgi:hypothetical protein
MAEAYPLLPRPYNPLELEPCQTVRITILRWEFGRAIIRPRYAGAPPEKEVVVLRVHCPPEQMIEQLRKLGRLPPSPPPGMPAAEIAVTPYWDIAQARLQEALKPLLPRPGGPPVTVDIHKVGTPPRAYFSVAVVPV